MKECQEISSLTTTLLQDDIPNQKLISRYQHLLDAGFCRCCGVLTQEQLSHLHNDKGQALYRRVEFDLAIVEYTKAIELDPSFSVALYNRGQIHYRLGRFNAALKDFKEALKCNPQFDDAKDGLRATLCEMDSSEVKSI